MGLGFSLSPVSQWCLCYPNWQTGFWVLHVFSYLILWTCKGDISGFNACNHYSLCIINAIYTCNTILMHFVHLPCHPFAMQYVSLFQSVQTFPNICAKLFTLWVSGSLCCQLSNGASAVQISRVAAEWFKMNYSFLLIFLCSACIHHSCIKCDHHKSIPQNDCEHTKTMMVSTAIIRLDDIISRLSCVMARLASLLPLLIRG